MMRLVCLTSLFAGALLGEAFEAFDAAGSCTAEGCSTKSNSLLQVPAAPSLSLLQQEHASSVRTFSSLLQRAEHTGGTTSLAHADLCSRIIKPSQQPYNFSYEAVHDSYNGSYSQDGQDRRLEPILGLIRDGFFVESGAADGEINSNTVFYEKRGWSGLLVEPVPGTFGRLLQKQRKAHAFQGGLSTTGAIGTMGLTMADCAGVAGDAQCSTLSTNGPITAATGSVAVLLAPLEALLQCIGRKTVDFWSLDVEGVETEILKNTPFDKVEVGVLLIENNKTPETKRSIQLVMEQHGFKWIGATVYDGIYVNPAYFKSRGLRVPESI